MSETETGSQDKLNVKRTKNTKMESEKDTTKNGSQPIDKTPKVIGVGGIFFYSEDLNETRAWYAKNLGFEINDWGSSSFETRNLENPEEINSFQWSPFKKGDAYFEPSKKDFMVNYLVQNMEGLVEKLQANGVTILDEITTYDFGKFVHIMDAEGNKLELWEPIQEGSK